jgi:hypothetical protein
MDLPQSARRLSNGSLSVGALRTVVRDTVKGTFAGGSVGIVVNRLLARAAEGDPLKEIVVHDGDLVVPELCTGREPFVSLLVVRGNLTVAGLYEDCLDPESTVVVTGDLRAERLVSEGFIEVHGSVLVEREALWLDNDACAEIFGDLRAGFLYTKSHAVKVHGRLAAPFIVGDSDHFECPRDYDFVEETDEDRKGALLAALPREALSIEGDLDDDDEWAIDYVRSDVLVDLVRTRKPVLREPT